MSRQDSVLERIPRQLLDDPTSFVGQMMRMRVTVTSRDKSVTAVYTVQDGTSVTFDAERLRGVNEPTLAASIVEVVDGVAKGYQQATASLSRSGDGPTKAAPTEVDEKRHREYRRRLSELVVRGDSPNGHVKVRFSGAATTELKIRPKSLDRVRLDDLADEVNTALSSAAAKFARDKRAIREAIYDYPF